MQKNIAASDNNSEVIEKAALSTFEYWNGLDGRAFNPNEIVIRKTQNSLETVSFTLVRATKLIQESLAFYEYWNGLEGRQFNPNLAPKQNQITEYYLRNGLCYKTIFFEYEALSTSYEYWNGLDGRQFNPNLILLRVTQTEWVRVRDGLWDKTTTIYEALAKSYEYWNGLEGRQFNPNISLKSSITEPDTTGAPTNLGDIGNNTTSDRQISVTVKAQQLAEDPYRPRERTINLEYANTEAQLTAYGENFNRFLTGRSQGKQFVGAIPTTSDFVPFNQVAVTDPFFGLVYYLRIDSIQYAINQTEAIAAFNGILCGSAPVATPTEVTRPVEIVLSVSPFLIDGSASITVPDYLPVSPFLIDGSASITVPDYLSLSSIFLIRS